MVGMTLKIWYFNKYFFILSRIPISANLSWRIKFSYILFVNNESFCIGISNTLKWPNEIITTVNKRVNILKVHDTFREASQAWPKSQDRATIQCRSHKKLPNRSSSRNFHYIYIMQKFVKSRILLQNFVKSRSRSNFQSRQHVNCWGCLI